MNGHVFTSQGRCSFTSAHRRTIPRYSLPIAAERLASLIVPLLAADAALATRIGPAVR